MPDAREAAIVFQTGKIVSKRGQIFGASEDLCVNAPGFIDESAFNFQGSLKPVSCNTAKDDPIFFVMLDDSTWGVETRSRNFGSIESRRLRVNEWYNTSL
jgi:hypothetical protein